MREYFASLGDSAHPSSSDPRSRVAWSRTYLLSTAASKAGASSTRELLLGGRNGTIYKAILEGKEEMFKNHDRAFRPLFTLPERQAIAGIQFEWFPVSDPKQGLVIVGTTTRLYQFAGAPNKQTDDGIRTFASIFSPYKDTTPSKARPHLLTALLTTFRVP